MNGMITTNGDYDLEEVKEKIRQYTVKGVVLKTSVKKPYVLPGDGKRLRCWTAVQRTILPGI